MMITMMMVIHKTYVLGFIISFIFVFLSGVKLIAIFKIKNLKLGIGSQKNQRDVFQSWLPDVVY